MTPGCKTLLPDCATKRPARERLPEILATVGATALLRHATARFLIGTAGLGSVVDWTLFATLVITVDRMTGGSPWATSLVLLAKLLTALMFAPLAARRTDRADLRRSLLAHETLRAGSVVATVAGFLADNLPLALAGTVAFEYAAAMQAAARESVTSRHVPPQLFTPINTVTALLSYGLLPVGAIVVRALGTGLAWALAVAGYGLLTLSYLRLPLSDVVEHRTPDIARWGRGRVPTSPRSCPSPALWRTVMAAALSLVPAVALFTLAPDLAGTWTGDRAATGQLFAWAVVGGGVGFALANSRRVPAEAGLVTAVAGLLAAAGGRWQSGLVLLGVGSGAAYLILQTRLQLAARDPSQFAAAFAALKAASAVAAVGAPALAHAASLRTVLLVGAGFAGAAVAVAGGVRRLLLGVLELALRGAVAVEVRGVRRDGPAVVVSNHPHWIDGPVALAADRSLRPVARWQPNPAVRLAIWVGDCVVTTARTGRRHRPAYAQAAEHLRAGGRIWLAPEGGFHQDAALRAPRSGAVRMAAAAGAPVQVLAIAHEVHAGPQWRRWRPWRRLRVTVMWGDWFHPCGDVAADNDRMMRLLADATGLPYAGAGSDASAA